MIVQQLPIIWKEGFRTYQHTVRHYNIIQGIILFILSEIPIRPDGSAIGQYATQRGILELPKEFYRSLQRVIHDSIE
jgi:hypothetical protein